MNIFQMLVVLAVVSFTVMIAAEILGYNITYIQALVAVSTLKALALFLAPEKEPIVLVKSRKEIEEEGLN